MARHAFSRSSMFAAAGLGLLGFLTPALASASVTQLSLGDIHSCALQSDGGVRCWGYGGLDGNDNMGQLGYANLNTIGDDETPFSAGPVQLGGPATQIAAGYDHTCAVLNGGTLRCWGEAFAGQLGYGNVNTIGDNEVPVSVNSVNVGGPVTQVATGGAFTCALLANGDVRCFGINDHAQLGQAFDDLIGDDESPVSRPVLPVGGVVTQLAAGGAHACALLNTGKVRCWGIGLFGQLGYGEVETVGDDETPASAGDVNVGATVTQITAGLSHTCALLNSGNVRCWGDGGSGQLGYGNIQLVGDDESPATKSGALDVNVGGPVVQISAGFTHTCALLANGRVRCWGDNSRGQLGYPGVDAVGDDESPALLGDVQLGDTAVKIAAGGEHTCAVLSTGLVRCWGDNAYGQLGYADTRNLGDDEVPGAYYSIVAIEVERVPLPRTAGFAVAAGLLGLGVLSVRRVRRSR
jgi:alpha-tubulin suppressor-like RCC1 family protein